jgi:peptidoglycan/xylan/chitin deacetylase (PgdA/CDA1 family)
VDTLDWKTRNTSKTVHSVLSQVKDGDIVLMHELYSQTGAAALEIIPKLAAAGYQMVTVSELAQYRGGVVPGGVYSHFYR